MSSKTFKSVVHGSSIQVHDNGEGVFIGLLREDSITRGTTLSKSDAPALALAVLEAAGVAESSDAGVAANYLRLHISEQERAKAEAREQAELEAEALELFNTRQKAIYGDACTTYKEFATDNAKQTWLAVARRAREMRAER